MATDVKVKESDGLDTIRSSSARGGLYPMDQYVKIVAGAVELPDQQVDALEIAAQIMSAGSLAEGLGESNVEHLNDYDGEKLLIHDFKLNKSDEKFAGQGSKVYAIIDGTSVKDGNRIVLSSGSIGVLAALGLMMKLNQWDQAFRVKRIEAGQGTATKLIYEGAAPVADTGEAF